MKCKDCYYLEILERCKTCFPYDRDCPEFSSCPYLFGVLGYNPETDCFGLLRKDVWEIDALGRGLPM